MSLAPAGLRRTLGEICLALAGIATLVGAWWVATTLVAAPGSLLTRFGPVAGLSALGELIAGGHLIDHALASLRRVVLGLALAAALGIPLGLAIGSWPAFSRAGGPVFGLLRMISPLSWTPIAIIALGVGDGPVVFLIAIGAIWPVALNTAAGVAAVEPAWLTLGRSLGSTRAETLRHIVWPAIRAHVLTGLRLASGLGWIILVPAEMLGVDSGLGYFILDSRDRFAYDELIAGIIAIGLLGVALDGVARLAFRVRRTAGVPARRSRTARLRPAGRPAEERG